MPATATPTAAATKARSVCGGQDANASVGARVSPKSEGNCNPVVARPNAPKQTGFKTNQFSRHMRQALRSALGVVRRFAAAPSPSAARSNAASSAASPSLRSAKHMNATAGGTVVDRDRIAMIQSMGST